MRASRSQVPRALPCRCRESILTCPPTVLDAINFFEAEIVHDPFVPTPGRARPEERRAGVELRSWGGWRWRGRERAESG